MANSKTKFSTIILLVIVIGFLLASFIFYFKNSKAQETKYSSGDKIVQLQVQAANQTIALTNQNQTANCLNSTSNSNSNLHVSNAKLNEAINLTEIKKQYRNQSIAGITNLTVGLLSPRIYAGILEPRSFLITNFEPLKNGIKSFLDEHNISASIYIENLRNGANIGVHQLQGYFPASLNKLPVAVLVMQKIEDGILSFNTTLPIKDFERSNTSGNLYLTSEKELTVKILLEKMLKESDNTAFNVLIDNIDKNDLAQLLDYYNIKINVDYPYERLRFENHTNLVTPLSLYNIFADLYLSTTLYAPDSEYILSLLSDTEFDVKSIANLPDNVTVSQKYGEFYADDTKLFHDCGIMYIQDTRIFYCIMTKDLDTEDAKDAIGYIINYIYHYIIDQKFKLSAYKKHVEKA